jgi:hypothetical protein
MGRWMDDSSGYAILEALREVREEQDHARRRIVAGLAHRARHRLPTEYERDLKNTQAALRAFTKVAEELKSGRKPSTTPSPTAAPPHSPKLSREFLREAAALATRWAEEDALAMLAAKARQVAELDRRRPRLVWNRDQIKPAQA